MTIEYRPPRKGSEVFLALMSVGAAAKEKNNELVLAKLRHLDTVIDVPIAPIANSAA